MSKTEDLLTVSVGPARKAWVRANKWPASKAMQRAIDEAIAKQASDKPAGVNNG